MSRKVLMLYRDEQRVPPYRDALLAADLDPQVVEAGSAFSLDGADGLLLTGGQDVDPALYGEARHEKTDSPDPQLDRAEMDALDEALRLDLPVLAICRGMQVLNVHHGGKLVQHLLPVERHRSVKDGDRSLPVHSVAIEVRSLLSRVAAVDAWQVNSRHHQAVNTLGDGLRVSGVDPGDGVIEAIERPDRTFVLGVQWHPEDQIRRDAAQLNLFRSFHAAMGR
jgi:putative glutamine amidotransferase